MVVWHFHKFVRVKRKQDQYLAANRPNYGGMKANLVKTEPNGLELKSDFYICHYDE